MKTRITASVKKRGPKPKGKIPVWSADLAYVVGLIASDGCLSGDGCHVDITSKDLSLIRTALKILKKKNTPSIKKNGSGGYSWRVQFGDVVFHNWLNTIGLTPKKSLTIRALDVPERFFRDFVRGVWDGDGTAYSYFDPRWGTHTYYIGFASASRVFAAWLQESILKHVRVRGHITRNKTASGNIMYQVRYAKAESKEVFAWMFYRKNLPHLPRKFAKMQKILTIESHQVDKRFAKKHTHY